MNVRWNQMLLIPIALFFLQLESCERDKISGEIVSDSKLMYSLYNLSTDTLIFDSNKYILETDLYRNLMPGGPIPERRPLVAVVYLVNTDSIPVSGDLEIEKLYIINEQQIWISVPGKEAQSAVPDFKLEWVRNEGPLWGPDINVDVVIELENKLTMQRFFLIAKDQLIEKVV
jgi:hypothetical protein